MMTEAFKESKFDLESELARTEKDFKETFNTLTQGLEQSLPLEDLDKMWKDVRAANSYRHGTRAIADGRPYIEIGGFDIPSQLVGLMDELHMRPEAVAALEGLFISADDYKKALDSLGEAHEDPRLAQMQSRLWQEGI